MGLSGGDRLGRLEIIGPLGAGGMGEVYRARDPQLQREVAVKILPAAFQADPERRRRFEQEARAAGSLNHPNILAVHDVGVHGSATYIVTELLEGETLRQRLAGRPLPVRKALNFAAQIASGLAAGHERGIVHRDIKPDNLFVTTDGRIKILDYGLAKLLGSEEGNTETITIDGEHRTPVMGTVTYMSPEQARGLPMDHRTDIFSLGVVLYEMLAGYAPFRRAPAETKRDPARRSTRPAARRRRQSRLGTHRSPLPGEATRRAVSERSGSAVRSGKPGVLDRSTVSGNTPAAAGIETDDRREPGELRARRRRDAWLCRARSVSAGRNGGVDPSVRAITDFLGLEESSSLSPADGRSVVFTAQQAGRRQIFVRLLSGRGEPLRLTNDDADHQQPRWLPDESAILYFTPAAPGEVQGTIYSVPALGGAPPRSVIASIDAGDVGSNRRVAFFRLVSERIELATCALDGSDVRTIHRFPATIQYYRFPRWSPDLKWIAYQAGDGYRWDLHVVSTSGGQPSQLTVEKDMIRGLSWLPDSSGIVYSSSRAATVPYLPPLTLWTVALDKTPPKQLMAADVWYEQPDVHPSGVVSATRMQMRSDVWRFPLGPNPVENVSRREPVTRQTSHVLTPSARATAASPIYRTAAVTRISG